MNKQILRLLIESFTNRKSPEYSEFRNKITTECGISYSTLNNYTSPGSKCKIPKLVGEKIIEIVKRDYPEKAELLNQFMEVA